MKVFYESKIAKALRVKTIMLFGAVFTAISEDRFTERDYRHEYIHTLQWRSLLGVSFMAGIVLWCTLYAITKSPYSMFGLMTFPMLYYVWYVLEFIIRFSVLFIVEREGFRATWKKAYRSVVFEQEAYDKETSTCSSDFEMFNVNFMKYYKKLFKR